MEIACRPKIGVSSVNATAVAAAVNWMKNYFGHKSASAKSTRITTYDDWWAMSNTYAKTQFVRPKGVYRNYIRLRNADTDRASLLIVIRK